MRNLVLVAVAVLMLAALVFGAWTLTKRGAPAGPDLAVVTTTQLAPVEGERAVAGPLERALMAVDGVTRVETRVTGSVVVTRLWLRPNVDSYAAFTPVREAITKAALPPDVLVPSVQRLSHAQTARWLLEDEGMPLTELRGWAEEHVVRKTEMKQGVREVELCGVEPEEDIVHLDPQRMRALGVTAAQVLDVLAPMPSGLRIGARRPELRELLDRPIGRGRVADLASAERRHGPDRCVALHGGRVLLVTVRSEQALQEPAFEAMPGLHTTPLGATSSLSVWIPTPAMAPHLAELARAVGVAQAVVVVHPASGPVKGAAEAQLLVSPPLTAERAVGLVRAVLAEPGVALAGVEDVPSTRVLVSGDDREALSRVSAALASSLNTGGGVAVAVEAPRQPELRVVPDREKLALFRISPADLTQAMQLATGGVERDGVRALWPEIEGPGELAQLDVGSGITLEQVARLEAGTQPAWLLRAQGRPAAEVLVFGLDLDQIREAVQRVALPPGMMVELR